jgi:SET domain-containing protein
MVKLHAGLQVKKTQKMGYGLFAVRDYKKGDVVLKATGVRIAPDDKRLTHRGFQIAHDVFIEPSREDVVWYMNHSCEPNCYVTGERVIAKRRILSGEQITTDYSLFTDYSTWDMPCACQAPTCRKLILPYRKHVKKHAVRPSLVSAFLRKSMPQRE